MKRSLISEVENLLRASRKPYIAVDETKRVLFRGQKLASFHFVVYFPEAVNWLVMCGERTKEKKELMREWKEVFGDGFKTVFALRRSGGIRFTDGEGTNLELEPTGNAPAQGAVSPAPLVGADTSLGRTGPAQRQAITERAKRGSVSKGFEQPCLFAA